MSSPAFSSTQIPVENQGQLTLAGSPRETCTSHVAEDGYHPAESLLRGEGDSFQGRQHQGRRELQVQGQHSSPEQHDGGRQQEAPTEHTEAQLGQQTAPEHCSEQQLGILRQDLLHQQLQRERDVQEQQDHFDQHQRQASQDRDLQQQEQQLQQQREVPPQKGHPETPPGQHHGAKPAMLQHKEKEMERGQDEMLNGETTEHGRCLSDDKEEHEEGELLESLDDEPLQKQLQQQTLEVREEPKEQQVEQQHQPYAFEEEADMRPCGSPESHSTLSREISLSESEISEVDCRLPIPQGKIEPAEVFTQPARLSPWMQVRQHHTASTQSECSTAAAAALRPSQSEVGDIQAVAALSSVAPPHPRQQKQHQKLPSQQPAKKHLPPSQLLSQQCMKLVAATGTPLPLSSSSALARAAAAAAALQTQPPTSVTLALRKPARWFEEPVKTARTRVAPLSASTLEGFLHLETASLQASVVPSSGLSEAAAKAAAARDAVVRAAAARAAALAEARAAAIVDPNAAPRTQPTAPTLLPKGICTAPASATAPSAAGQVMNAARPAPKTSPADGVAAGASAITATQSAVGTAMASRIVRLVEGVHEKAADATATSPKAVQMEATTPEAASAAAPAEVPPAGPHATARPAATPATAAANAKIAAAAPKVTIAKAAVARAAPNVAALGDTRAAGAPSSGSAQRGSMAATSLASAASTRNPSSAKTSIRTATDGSGKTLITHKRTGAPSAPAVEVPATGSGGIRKKQNARAPSADVTGSPAKKRKQNQISQKPQHPQRHGQEEGMERLHEKKRKRLVTMPTAKKRSRDSSLGTQTSGSSCCTSSCSCSSSSESPSGCNKRSSLPRSKQKSLLRSTLRGGIATAAPPLICKRQKKAYKKPSVGAVPGATGRALVGLKEPHARPLAGQTSVEQRRASTSKVGPVRRELSTRKANTLCREHGESQAALQGSQNAEAASCDMAADVAVAAAAKAVALLDRLLSNNPTETRCPGGEDSGQYRASEGATGRESPAAVLDAPGSTGPEVHSSYSISKRTRKVKPRHFSPPMSSEDSPFSSCANENDEERTKGVCAERLTCANDAQGAGSFERAAQRQRGRPYPCYALTALSGDRSPGGPHQADNGQRLEPIHSGQNQQPRQHPYTAGGTLVRTYKQRQRSSSTWTASCKPGKESRGADASVSSGQTLASCQRGPQESREPSHDGGATLHGTAQQALSLHQGQGASSEQPHDVEQYQLQLHRRQHHQVQQYPHPQSKVQQFREQGLQHHQQQQVQQQQFHPQQQQQQALELGKLQQHMQQQLPQCEGFHPRPLVSVTNNSDSTQKEWCFHARKSPIRVHSSGAYPFSLSGEAYLSAEVPPLLHNRHAVPLCSVSPQLQQQMPPPCRPLPRLRDTAPADVGRSEDREFAEQRCLLVTAAQGAARGVTLGMRVENLQQNEGLASCIGMISKDSPIVEPHEKQAQRQGYQQSARRRQTRRVPYLVALHCRLQELLRHAALVLEDLRDACCSSLEAVNSFDEEECAVKGNVVKHIGINANSANEFFWRSEMPLCNRGADLGNQTHRCCGIQAPLCSAAEMQQMTTSGLNEITATGTDQMQLQPQHRLQHQLTCQRHSQQVYQQHKQRPQRELLLEPQQANPQFSCTPQLQQEPQQEIRQDKLHQLVRLQQIQPQILRECPQQAMRATLHCQTQQQLAGLGQLQQQTLQHRVPQIATVDEHTLHQQTQQRQYPVMRHVPRQHLTMELSTVYHGQMHQHRSLVEDKQAQPSSQAQQHMEMQQPKLQDRPVTPQQQGPLELPQWQQTREPTSKTQSVLQPNAPEQQIPPRQPLESGQQLMLLHLQQQPAEKRTEMQWQMIGQQQEYRPNQAVSLQQHVPQQQEYALPPLHAPTCLRQQPAPDQIQQQLNLQQTSHESMNQQPLLKNAQSLEVSRLHSICAPLEHSSSAVPSRLLLRHPGGTDHTLFVETAPAAPKDAADGSHFKVTAPLTTVGGSSTCCKCKVLSAPPTTGEDSNAEERDSMYRAGSLTSAIITPEPSANNMGRTGQLGLGTECCFPLKPRWCLSPPRLSSAQAAESE